MAKPSTRPKSSPTPSHRPRWKARATPPSRSPPKSPTSSPSWRPSPATSATGRSCSSTCAKRKKRLTRSSSACAGKRLEIDPQIALGIIAALGGFLDIGDLVFNTQAGALYRYDLLWAVVLGTMGIAVYAEMCGRVAAVTQRPVFDTIRMRMGFGMGLVALVASTFVNVLTVAAELGGLAIILKLLFDATFSMFVVLAAIGLVLVVAPRSPSAASSGSSATAGC